MSGTNETLPHSTAYERYGAAADSLIEAADVAHEEGDTKALIVFVKRALEASAITLRKGMEEFQNRHGSS